MWSINVKIIQVRYICLLEVTTYCTAQYYECCSIVRKNSGSSCWGPRRATMPPRLLSQHTHTKKKKKRCLRYIGKPTEYTCGGGPFFLRRAILYQVFSRLSCPNPEEGPASRWLHSQRPRRTTAICRTCFARGSSDKGERRAERCGHVVGCIDSCPQCMLLPSKCDLHYFLLLSYNIYI